MKRAKSNVHFMSQYRTGDELLIQFEGCLPATVQRVTFKGRKVLYVVSVSVECEVPEGHILAGEKGGATVLLPPPVKRGGRSK